jgi:hypothetical protein
LSFARPQQHDDGHCVLRQLSTSPPRFPCGALGSSRSRLSCFALRHRNSGCMQVSSLTMKLGIRQPRIVWSGIVGPRRAHGWSGIPGRTIPHPAPFGCFHARWRA